jgi:hypothetical protein
VVEAEVLVAATGAAMVEAEAGAAVAVMASARPLLFAPVRAAGGLPTAVASAGGDIDSIVTSGGIRDKDSGVPGNRPAFFFWRIASAAMSGGLACSPPNLPAAGSA